MSSSDAFLGAPAAAAFSAFFAAFSALALAAFSAFSFFFSAFLLSGSSPLIVAHCGRIASARSAAARSTWFPAAGETRHATAA